MLKSERKSQPGSQAELFLLGNGVVKALPQALDTGIDGIVVPFTGEELMGDVQRCHHRDAIHAEYLSALTDVTHLLVQKARGCLERILLAGRAVHLIFPIEDADVDVLTHQSCSRALSRLIIASTLVFASSFFSMS